MRKRKIVFVLLALILMLMFSTTLGVRNLINKNRADPIDYLALKQVDPPQAIIEFPAELHYRQGYNECGPYNVAAVISTLTQQKILGNQIAKELPYRIINGYSLPPGLEQILTSESLNVKTYFLTNLSDEDKVRFLKRNLLEKKLIILLGENYKVQHYITVLGYTSIEKENPVFHIYDSYHPKGTDEFTIDSNGELPGNRDFTKDELFKFWSGGGMLGFYKWYALTTGRYS